MIQLARHSSGGNIFALGSFVASCWALQRGEIRGAKARGRFSVLRRKINWGCDYTGGEFRKEARFI